MPHTRDLHVQPTHTMAETQEHEAQPPYISFQTVRNFAGSFRSTGLPNRIDRSLIVGQSGGTQSYLLSALRFFGLMDASNKPTERWARLNADSESEPEVWKEAVMESYSFLFGDSFNHETATDAEIAEKFREKKLSGATIRKCMSCFASACEVAGIKTSPHLKAGKRPSGGGGRPAARRQAKKKPNGGDTQSAPAAPAPASASTSMQQALLAKFPDFDPGWPEDLKTKWFDGFAKFMASAAPASVPAADSK